MVRVAVAVVFQHLNDTAFADMAVAAFLDHALQFAPESLKLLDPDFHLYEMRTRYGVSRRAARLRGVRQMQEFTDLNPSSRQCRMNFSRYASWGSRNRCPP